MVLIPPIPEPIATPKRSGLNDPSTRSESSYACTPAAMPYCMKISMRRASLGSMKSLQWKSLRDPPKRVVKLLVSKCSIGPIPLLPFFRALHELFASFPTGVNNPKPVTTILLLVNCASKNIYKSPNKQKPP